MKKYAESFVAELVALYKNQLSAIRNIKLSQNRPGISHQHILSHATYSPWLDDLEFVDAYQKIKSHTLVDEYRCYELFQSAKRSAQLSGVFVEIGVWRGGTAALLGLAAGKKPLFLFDTFEGVVKPSDKDTVYKGGEHSDTSEPSVNAFLLALGLSNYELIKGIFPDHCKLPVSQVSLCHIDVDTYHSAKDCFWAVWPHLQVGGVVIFDDYGFWGCEGVTELCNELAADFSPREAAFVHNLCGHALFFKVS
jgi:O-methyltransferase